MKYDAASRNEWFLDIPGFGNQAAKTNAERLV